MDEDQRPIVGNLAISVENETIEPVQCNIKGEVPTWLSGSLYRNGTGKFEFGKDKYNHLFDGVALINKYMFNNGQVTYQNQFLKGEAFSRNTAAQRIVCSAFGTIAYPDPCKSIFTRYFSYYFESLKPFDNNVVNVMQLADQLYALSEANILVKVDPKTLGYKSQVDISKIIAVHMASAHPHVDKDGTTYNLGMSFGRQFHYKVLRITKASKEDAEPLNNMTVLASILPNKPTSPGYYHSFSITENYIVIIDQPVRLAGSLKGMAAVILKFKTIMDLMEWHPEDRAVFYVVDKKTGEVVSRHHESDPFFVFHTINAYEEDDHIVLDLCAYNDLGDMKAATIEVMSQNKPTSGGNFRRFVLPLSINKDCETDQVNLAGTTATAVWRKDHVLCTPESVCKSVVAELPQINYRYNGQKYRYAYCWSMDRTIHRVVKVDLETKTVIPWHDGEPFISGEAVFVARPGATDEDDGIVLASFVSREKERPSFLAFLDGKSFQEVARAEIPAEVNFTFHGIHTETLD